MAAARTGAVERRLVTQKAMMLLEVLLAGFLRWVGLPPADLNFLTIALRSVPGATEPVQPAGSEPKERA